MPENKISARDGKERPHPSRGTTKKKNYTMKKLPKNNAFVKMGQAFTDDPIFITEKIILGSMMCDNQIIPETVKTIDGRHFANAVHKGLFILFRAMNEQQQRVNSYTVFVQLSEPENKHLFESVEAIGGAAWLSELEGDEWSETLSGVKQHCQFIKERQKRRQTEKALRTAQAALSDGRTSLSRVMSTLHDNLPSEAIGTEKAGFKFTCFSEYMAGDLQPPQWLIKNILEKEALAVLFGPPESYKSFIAIDWGLSIAAQTPWHGHFVTGGPVFSIIGEGKNGYRRRIAAWQQKAVVAPGLPFFVSETPAQILDINSARAVGESINALRDEHGTPALVIIDTLARNFGPGHENDTKDMTSFISNLDEYIGRDFARLIVHHTGLSDQNRSRGNSSLRAALDAEYKMAHKDGRLTLSCEKMKDSIKFKPICFEPEIIALGGTEHDPITSVVLSQVERQQPTVKLTTQLREALTVITTMCDQKVSSPLSDCLRAIKDKKIYSRTAVYSAVDKLEDKGLIVITGDYVQLSSLSSSVLIGNEDTRVDVSSLSSLPKGRRHEDTLNTEQKTTVVI